MRDWRCGVDVFEWKRACSEEYATRHTLQAGSCASTVPGHTAAARPTKVVKSWRRMAGLLKDTRNPMSGTFPLCEWKAIPKHQYRPGRVRTRRLLWVRSGPDC